MELTRESFEKEVAMFKGSFKEDAFSTAEKSLTLQKKGNIGIINFDQFQEKANKLSTPNMMRFFELCLHLFRQPTYSDDSGYSWGLYGRGN